MYPALFFVERPAKSSRLLLLFRSLLIVPHMFWSMFYGMAAGFVQLLSFWAILFTARHPRALWDFLARYLRYRSCVIGYMLILCDRYPPFNGKEGDGYPVRTFVSYPERLSRATVFFRPLLMIPHFFYVIGFAVVVGAVHFLTFWTVLFLGRMSSWQFAWIHAWFIYTERLDAYMLFLVDEYPPFNGLQPRAADDVFA